MHSDITDNCQISFCVRGCYFIESHPATFHILWTRCALSTLSAISAWRSTRASTSSSTVWLDDDSATSSSRSSSRSSSPTPDWRRRCSVAVPGAVSVTLKRGQEAQVDWWRSLHAVLSNAMRLTPDGPRMEPLQQHVPDAETESTLTPSLLTHLVPLFTTAWWQFFLPFVSVSHILERGTKYSIQR